MTNPFANPFAAPAQSGAVTQQSVTAHPTVAGQPSYTVTSTAAGPPAAPAPAQQYTQPAGDPYGDDPFGAPAPQAERPRIADLAGRLLLVSPLRLEEGLPNRLQPGTTQDRMTVNIVVLDPAEPIAYGGRPEEGVPHTKQMTVPATIERSYISQRGLISQLRQALVARLAGQGRGMTLGRLYRGQPTQPGQKGAWLLSIPTEAERELARRYLASAPADPFAAPSQPMPVQPAYQAG